MSLEEPRSLVVASEQSLNHLNTRSSVVLDAKSPISDHDPTSKLSVATREISLETEVTCALSASYVHIFLIFLDLFILIR